MQSTLKKKNTPIFNIVHFYKSTSNGKKCMDCIPSTWISFDPENQELVAKFMPPPYTKKKSGVLHELVQNQKTPLEKWPQYSIKILETAETYTEALSKMKKLINEDFDYTTDYCTTDVEDDDNNRNLKKIKTEENLTLPVYTLTGEVSKCIVSSSNDSDSNIENDMYNELNKKSIISKKKKSQKNSDINSSNISTAKNMPSSSFSGKCTVVEDIILKNPIKPVSFNDIMNYLKCILTDLQDIKYNQQLMTNDLQILKIDFEQNMIKRIEENVPVHWTKENEIKWPLQTKEEYDKLNLLLANEKIRKDFMTTIGFLIHSGTVVSKNLLAVFKKFFHKDLATKFTCVKPIKNKFTLKPSALYDCVIEVFMTKSETGAIPETVTEKVLEKLIGAILTNSKDWNKGRLHNKTETKDKENVNDKD